MNKLIFTNKIIGQNLRFSNPCLPKSTIQFSKQSMYKPLCQYQFTKYRFGSKQISSGRPHIDPVFQQQLQSSSKKITYLLVGAGALLGGYFGLNWIKQKSLILQEEEQQQQTKYQVEKAIDNEEYSEEIALLEKEVMESSYFSLEYAFILHFSYVKLQMFDKAEALELRMKQYYPKQTLIIQRYIASHYLANQNYVEALKHLIFAASNYNKVSQEDKNHIQNEIEPYLKDIENAEQLSDMTKKDLFQFLGQIYSYLRLYKESEYFFRQSVSLKPQDILSQFELAVSLLHQQYFDESEQILQGILQKPNIDSNLKTLAAEELSIIYLCENNQQKALEVCQMLNLDNEQQCIDMIERIKVKQKKRQGQN
ncbi:transmembrane protein, putative (macronuclear) [Tetrahymena thermophila SB210]|uniref:Transmembrane protein, putative n=1 Tax=Tetrahymena thermophila (strain SB210) TaxID=312017 RepID=Q23RH9_TETTS|nr:transmembrane protein, putative [Tetrahymena thermophila SB210]EAR99069.1 transmembrane protein, putative [Tetrahymena thermophila SB210]|eukprot:XP_001019314.1 transmembrane protein, putative [Tetrahymena thermophila SB210]